MHFCVWILFGIYSKDSIYDIMIKQKKLMCKEIAKKSKPKKSYELLNGLKWTIFS